MIILQVTIDNVGDIFDIFCLFQRIFRLFGFPHVVQKQMLGGVGNEVVIKSSFDDQLCQEYWCQKLLKSDSPSLSYNGKCCGSFLRHSVNM